MDFGATPGAEGRSYGYGCDQGRSNPEPAVFPAESEYRKPVMPSMDARLTALEEEMKSTKTQIQQILLDLREHVLEFTNPFTAESKLALARKVEEKIGAMKDQ